MRGRKLALLCLLPLLLQVGCSGTTSCKATVVFRDLDGDRFGSPSSGAIEACSAEERERMDNAVASGDYVGDGNDCDDHDPNIHPRADELCDDIDHNCDGESEEGAVDRTEYYPDADEDGFGDAAAFPYLRCEPMTEMVLDSTDCDDANPAVNPAATEVTGNGLDDDCDPGTAD